MYGDQLGEFVCGYWGLKGLSRQGDGAFAGQLLEIPGDIRLS